MCVGWQITDGLWCDRQKEGKEEEERKGSGKSDEAEESNT